MCLFWTGNLATANKQDGCHCTLKCHYITYDYLLSTGSYPSEFVASQITSLFGRDAEYIK